MLQGSPDCPGARRQLLLLLAGGNRGCNRAEAAGAPAWGCHRSLLVAGWLLHGAGRGGVGGRGVLGACPLARIGGGPWLEKGRLENRRRCHPWTASITSCCVVKTPDWAWPCPLPAGGAWLRTRIGHRRRVPAQCGVGLPPPRPAGQASWVLGR